MLAGESPDVSRLPESPVRAFVLSACAFDAADRPSAPALLLHPWIVGGGIEKAKDASSPMPLEHAASSGGRGPSWKIGAGVAAGAGAGEGENDRDDDGDGDGKLKGDGNNDGELERAETVLPRAMSM